MKVAIPLEGSKLSGHFGGSLQFAFYAIENGSVVKKEIVDAPEHKPGIFPKWVVDQGITDLIVCGIGEKAEKVFLHHKVNLFKGAEIKEADELIKDFIAGTLKLSNEGCGNHHHEHGEHEHHHHGGHNRN
ncbi:MAG TPA: NifB/NifX family molybdenum-iron cluster-binding protein [Ignavibacteriales bacterium]|nr:NifB/NifX family molybdenum-iron cluster-binding protein [Ignavibacteriales bacterium]